MRKRRIALSVAAAAAVTAGTGVVTALPANAAAGCSVAYTVSNSWQGGFGASVTITNLGDAVGSWSLAWSFAAGQTVTQAWNATVTQSGSAVTARNAGYNGSIATNGTVSFGFNGSWTGSNPAPTAFTLNGTACTGGVTPPTGPTTPPPTTPPPTGGVPSDAVWSGSGQWDNWTSNGYTIYNNVWGSGAGTQTTWARSPGNWGVVANHPRTSGIKSYPNVSYTLNRTLSSLRTLTSSYNVTVPASGDYETAYDIWANNNAYEIMIWTNKQGAVGPIAEKYDANGAVPTAANVTVGGATWNIYRGSNGANAVFSFVRTSNSTSGTLDVLAMLNWLRTNSWWGDVTLGQFQFGYEISGTAGQSSFTTNSYTLGFS
ncbi:cellulose binding domain-containing protein [Couchioplanes caeruleus]|uniref:cellulose binding domain-containing protein n=1 Tax=Couchioplanes caeruleus TaxID=56438 RepID=UPI00201C0859|nr:cellulose binding domain-containing protein [Couchioplanes caeruleus]UQU62154.1 cellulose binding domain-containing protein [Couchioplanes caeruleus]